MTTNIVVRTDPQAMGISKSICKAMAPPSISASEVAYPLNEDDPPVTRLVAMAPACHASPCPSLSPTFIRQHLPDNRMR